MDVSQRRSERLRRSFDDLASKLVGAAEGCNELLTPQALGEVRPQAGQG
jgi:hypothetical protein